VAAALSSAGSEAAVGKRSVVGTLLSGNATSKDTAAYASRFSSQGYVPLGSTGLTTSRVGFGGYRVDDETPVHQEALEKALCNGCNLIDTSTNYTDGGSERCVGAVLGGLVRAGKLRREEVIVVSKIGYVQGTNLLLAQERDHAGQPFPEMVKYMEGCWHCIHPEWLGDQLQRSLSRLQLETPKSEAADPSRDSEPNSTGACAMPLRFSKGKWRRAGFGCTASPPTPPSLLLPIPRQPLSAGCWRRPERRAVPNTISESCRCR
jgi:hypothetical protein